ncbi:MAG: endonuclease [Hyphomicrobiales bacterium]|nr:endonuclease [Hyphomicrobiales bacterium]
MPRLLTWNVHRCVGRDGRCSPERIAGIIGELKPDVVVLQELDVRRRRTGGIDQAHVIAHRLGMTHHFHPAYTVMEEAYGDAILTARPSRMIRGAALPGIGPLSGLEPRGALWASVHLAGADVQIFNTHLGLRSRERLAQVDALLGRDWIGSPSCREPVIIAGDFNAVPRSRVYARLASSLKDAQCIAGRRKPQATFPSRLPLLRLDHVFVSKSIEVQRAETVRTQEARIASDHLALFVDFTVKPLSARAAHAPPERAEA